MDELRRIGERKLRSAGVRVTPQRRLVLDILATADGHLDANDIYELGRRHDQSLSLSTVYRTLAVLKEIGLVRELHLDCEQHHYELDGKDEHSHLVCQVCGRVIEVESTAFARVAQTVAQMYGFEVTDAQVELAGYCDRCRQQQG
ncbi:MAG TPA: transcriptional repressor [Anaerolineae bacterium]|nr:transcriptional repressor [Anaerolineae bacterium]